MEWNQLSTIWKAAFTEAVSSYLHRNSAPIGAVVVDGTGAVISTGGNNFDNNRLAHAELNALNSLPPEVDRKTCHLYSTLEPCPMCTGALRMMQFQGIHCGAMDPGAGFTAYLSANRFMNEFPCTVYPPEDGELEIIIVALIMEYRKRNNHSRWQSDWINYCPVGNKVGNILYESNKFQTWKDSDASPESLYSDVSKHVKDI